MQIHFNLKNLCFAFVVAFFLYLIYVLIFGSASNAKLPDLSVDIKDLINYCIVAAESGGYAVQRIQNEKFYWKKTKNDKRSSSGIADAELLTKADLVSNQLIKESLLRAPGLQVISEEKDSVDEKIVEKYKQNNYVIWSKSHHYVDALPSERFLLSDVAVWVDPLDATQEFSQDLLLYVTVMLCVTVRGRPKFGVIHRPFANQTVWGLVGYGVHPNITKTADKTKTVVVSRSHAGQVSEFLKKSLDGPSPTSSDAFKIEPAGGSGYKSLRILNGTASMYLHLTKIKKWDLCAPDAVLRAAGGRMTTLDGNELTYLAKDKIVNDRGLLATLNDQHFHYLSKFSPVWNDGRIKL